MNKRISAIVVWLFLLVNMCFGGTFIDTFSDGSYDSSNFDSAVNNNGTVTESAANSRLEIFSPAVVQDATVAIYNGVNPDRSKVWSAHWKFKMLALPNPQFFHSFLCTQPDTPTVGPSATIDSTHALVTYFRNVSNTYWGYFSYRTAAGTYWWWNNTTKTWTTSFSAATRIETLALDTFYYWKYSSDGTNLIIEMQDANQATIWGPASIAASSVNSNTLDWLVIGEHLTDFYFGNMAVYEFSYTGPEIPDATTNTCPDTSGTPSYKCPTKTGDEGTPMNKGKGTPCYSGLGSCP